MRPLHQTGSRLRFAEYLRRHRDRHAQALPSDSSPAPKHRTFVRLWLELRELLAGHRATLVAALAALSIATLLKLLPPAATKVVVDYVLLDRPLPAGLPAWLPVPVDPAQRLVLLAASVLVISLIGSTIGLWSRWRATLLSKRVQVAMRKRAFAHAARLPLHRVYQLKSGGSASLLREDAGGVGELVFSMLYNPWRAVLQFLGGLIVLAWVDWRLLIGSLVVLPAVYWTHRLWIRRVRPLYRAVRRQREGLDARTTEAFGGMRVVRAFGRQKFETTRFVLENHFMARQELHVWWCARLVEIIWELLIPLASCALLLYGGLQVLEGHLTPGDLMMFLVYLAMLLEPLAVLASTATQFQNNLAGFDRVLDLLAEPREMAEHPGTTPMRKELVAGRIRVRDVGFRYPGVDEFVLRGVDFEAAPGEVIALVGPSGAGKTTLCNLIARFYDPTDGVIEVDGLDLREIEVESYRRSLGIVEQDVFLFDGTVAENIGYAVRQTTFEEIERAARVANADEFISDLPDGYETVVGERGVRLSGGQRQRLAIARAVLADPRFLILDEATSNLDSRSEGLIQQALTELMKRRTTFVIAHRLSTIRSADRILVLEVGRIVESGTHDDLMARSGRYRDMVHLQRMHEADVVEITRTS